MGSHNHIIHPNWHIVTGESPENVQGVLEVLEEKRFRVVNENPNHWIDWAEKLDPYEFNTDVPIFFNRSEIDQNIHKRGEYIDFEKITLQSLKEYRWRHVYIVESEREASSFDALSRAAQLRKEYSKTGVPYTLIPSESSVEQASLIVEHFEQEQLEDMPHMG